MTEPMYREDRDDERKISDLHKIVNHLLSQPERKKGKWIDVDPYGDSGLAFKCSECRKINLRESNYCPNCGADMRGESHEND